MGVAEYAETVSAHDGVSNYGVISEGSGYASTLDLTRPESRSSIATTVIGEPSHSNNYYGYPCQYQQPPPPLYRQNVHPAYYQQQQRQGDYDYPSHHHHRHQQPTTVHHLPPAQGPPPDPAFARYVVVAADVHSEPNVQQHALESPSGDAPLPDILAIVEAVIPTTTDDFTDEIRHSMGSLNLDAPPSSN